MLYNLTVSAFLWQLFHCSL